MIVLALVNAAVGQAAKIDPAWVYIGQPLKWELPPKKAHLEIKTAGAEIIVLDPSGQLSEVGCFLIRQRDGKIVISRGDGEVVRAGTWTSNGDSLTLTSHVVFRTVQRIDPAPGQAAHEPDVKREVLRRGSNSLRENGEDRYVRLAEFDDFEFLSVLANEREVGGDARTN